MILHPLAAVLGDSSAPMPPAASPPSLTPAPSPTSNPPRYCAAGGGVKRRAPLPRAPQRALQSPRRVPKATCQLGGCCRCSERCRDGGRGRRPSATRRRFRRQLKSWTEYQPLLRRPSSNMSVLRARPSRTRNNILDNWPRTMVSDPYWNHWFGVRALPELVSEAIGECSHETS